MVIHDPSFIKQKSNIITGYVFLIKIDLQPPFDPFKIIQLLNSSPKENSIKFLQRCQQYMEDPTQNDFTYTNPYF